MKIQSVLDMIQMFNSYYVEKLGTTQPSTETKDNESVGVGKYLKSATSSTFKKRNFDNDELDTEPIKKKSKLFLRMPKKIQGL